nr:uncharacterized protein LOC110070957 [Pogona vitticeps]
MQGPITSLFLFFMLLPTGVSLTCEICSGDTNCTGEKKACPEGQDACAINLMQGFRGTNKFWTVSKNCTSSFICHLEPVDVALGEGKSFKADISCCVENNCIPAFPKLPRSAKVHNGKICPTCFSATKDCSEKPVYCSGSDIYCLSFILVQGVSLECEFCSASGNHCSGRMITCSPGHDTCLIVLFESTLGDMMVQRLTKSCAISTACTSSTEYMNMGRGKLLRTAVLCCTGRACKTAAPQLLPLEKKTNGKQCPACYSRTGACNPDLLNCTGSEKYCFDLFARTYTPDEITTSFMMGCTTKAGCDAIDHGTTPYLEGIDTVVVKSRCLQTDTSKGFRSSRSLLPTFSGVLPVLLIIW